MITDNRISEGPKKGDPGLAVDLCGFIHDLDGGLIHVPGERTVSVTNDSTSFHVPVIFTPRTAPRPQDVHTSKHRIPVIALAAAAGSGGSGVAEAVVGAVARLPSSLSTPQAIIYHRLVFPYRSQWCLVPAGMTGHGISPPLNVLVDLPVRDAIVKGGTLQGCNVLQAAYCW
jgi:hypothetical protein